MVVVFMMCALVLCVRTITLAWATLESSVGSAIYNKHTCTYIRSHTVARSTPLTHVHLLVSQRLAISSDQSIVAALPHTPEVAHQIQHGAGHALWCCDQPLCGDFCVCLCSRAHTTHTTATVTRNTIMFVIGWVQDHA